MKRLLLTGASSEIGHAIARAAVAADWDVALCCHTAEAKTAAFAKELATVRDDAKCRAFAFDLRDSAAAESAVGDAAEFLGGLDGVVLAHGVTHQRLLAELPDDEWRSVIDTNLTGAFFVIRECLREMITQRSGAFVFVTSTAAYGMAGAGAYAASKAALHGLSATIAEEYGERGIRSNALAVGAVAAGMFTRTHDAAAQRAFAEKSALRRLGEPQDVAGAALFLLSPAAQYITGQVLDLDGGKR